MAEPAEAVIGVLRQEWSAIATLCARLSDEDWDRPTECPGWSVMDNLSHLVGTERSLLGEPAPSVPAPIPSHVRNDMGATNEAWVEARRSLSGPEVLREFVEVTERRLEALGSWPRSRFDEIVPSPVGQVEYREFLSVRAMDCWVHEQDIRVATGRRGHTGGVAAQNALDRLNSAMGFVVAKKASAPEGAWVRFEIPGDLGRRLEVVVRHGRGIMTDEPTTFPTATMNPTATLRMGQEVYWRLACGRVEGRAALSTGLVEVEGDQRLARGVLDSMAFMI